MYKTICSNTITESCLVWSTVDSSEWRSAFALVNSKNLAVYTICKPQKLKNLFSQQDQLVSY